MGLVKGFTDILCPQNLVPNGNFTINQRGLFTSYSPIVSGDYPVDAWHVVTLTFDSCEAYSRLLSTTAGIAELRFRGYGKKGQYITLSSKEYFSLNTAYPYAVKVTAKYTIQTAPTSIPITARLKCPSAVTTNTYSNAKTLKPGQISDIVTIGENTSVTSGAYMMLPWITLEADGYFEFYLSRAMLLSGEFVNPPNHIVTNHTDDLLRCKRHYQTGLTKAAFLGRETASAYTVALTTNFGVSMIATPSIVLEPLEVFEEGSSTNVVENYTFSSSPTANLVTVSAFKDIGGAKPSQLSVGWTATV